MTYDPEKYRVKRERVLGIRQRTLSFSTIITLFALLIVTAAGAWAGPRLLTYMATRNLDDAIFKQENGDPWPDSAVETLARVTGVKTVVTDTGTSRLVVTFHRHQLATHSISSVLARNGFQAVLLNHTPHRQRMDLLARESENETL